MGDERQGAACKTHHARGSVVCRDVFGQVVPRKGLYVFCGAQDCAAQRAVLESCGMQVIKHHLLRNAFHLHANSLKTSQSLAAESLGRAHLL